MIPDIAERLMKLLPQQIAGEPSDISVVVSADDILAAVAEIDYLRSLTSTVSHGETLADIKIGLMRGGKR